MNYTVPAAEVTWIAVTAGSAAVLNTIADTGGAGDIQTLAVLGSISCARTDLRQALSDAQWCLTPVSFGPAVASQLYGTFTLGMGFLVCHFIFFLICRAQIRDVSLNSKEKWTMAGTRAFYPSLSYAVLMFFFQGVALRTAQNYMKGESASDGLGMSFVAGMFTFAMIGGLIFWSTKKFYGNFVKYDQGFRGHPDILRKIGPKGFWEPIPYLKRFGYLFFSFAEKRVFFSAIIWGRMAIFASVASLESVGSKCNTQFGALAAILFAYAILLLWLRPYRYVVQNIITVMSSTFVAMIALSGYMDWEATPKIMATMTTCWLITAFLMIGAYLYEWTTIRKKEVEYRESMASPAPAPSILNTFFSSSSQPFL